MMIKNGILSYFLRYKDGKEEKELLRDHIQDALKYADQIENKRLGRFVSRNLNTPDFGKLLRYSIIFHDAGKVFFQSEKYIRHDDKSEYLSFFGHEFVSALIADSFIDEKIRQTCDNIYVYTSVVFAVMYHHHAMNIEARMRAINSIARIMEPETKKAYLEELKHLLSEFLEGDDYGILVKIMDKLRFTRNAVKVVQDKLSQRLIQNPRYVKVKKLSFVLLDALIVCDYLAAKQRESGRSTFFDAVKDFYNAWFI